MRSTNLVAFVFLALLSALQLAFAKPDFTNKLADNGLSQDIAPTAGNSHKALDGNVLFTKFKSSGLICPVGTGLCPNDRRACCPSGNACCGNKTCCQAGTWCYGGFCCPSTSNGCDGKGCCPQGWNCCQGGKCCPPGYYCIRNWAGEVRCCPNGQKCAFKNAVPSKAGATA